MIEILSEVYYKNSKILYLEMVKQKTFYYTENNEKISRKEFKENKATFLCNKCKRKKELFIYRAILLKPYICQSFNKIGELNPFYGEKHTEDFKNKISAECKGKWGDG